ncbi:MAG: flavin reductase family protein [Thalassotalea sp.]
MIINFSEYAASQRYHLMTQTIIPRPIAWALTTSNKEGQLDNIEQSSLNLAPYSYFTAISSEPALLMLSAGKKPNGDFKDTLVNVLKNKKMVIHIANENQADLVTHTAATLEHGESELSGVNGQLATVAFEGFELPRLAHCDIAYGCDLYETQVVGNTAQTLIFVEIKQLYLNPDVININDDNRIKVLAGGVKPLARLGANEYSGISAAFKKQRPA